MNTNTNNTNIPNNLIEYIINDIHDETDIKCVLRLLYLISCQPESTPWITYSDFLRDEFMSNSQLPNDTTKNQKKVISLKKHLSMRALLSLIQKELLLSQIILIENNPTRIFAFNLTSTKEILSKHKTTIQNSESITDDIKKTFKEIEEQFQATQITNVFNLYEKMIGPLNPMIADKLKEASNIYPHRWITNAFNESVRNNKKNWNYISAILKQKAYPENIRNGKTNGKSIGNTKKNAPKRFLGN